jgi:SAM-dependent methyltransferase
MVNDSDFDMSFYCRDLKLLSPGVWGIDRKSQDNEVHYPADAYQINARLEETSFWFKHRNNCIIQVIKNFPTPGPIFDVGGGNGIVTQALRKSGHFAILVEPGADAIAAAQKKKILPIIQANFLDLSFTPGSLPAVGLFDVLEHIEDQEDFLIKTHQLMAAKGTLYLTLPANPKLWSEEDVKAKHFRRYTRGNLQKLLQICGFEVEYITYFFSYLVFPVFFVRSLPFLLGRKRSIENYKKDHLTQTGFLINYFNKWEASKVAKKSHLSFGTSLIAVARK